MYCCTANKQNIQYRSQGWKQEWPHIPLTSLTYLEILFFLFLQLWVLQISRSYFPKRKYIFFQEKNKRPTESKATTVASTLQGSYASNPAGKKRNCSFGKEVGDTVMHCRLGRICIGTPLIHLDAFWYALAHFLW